MTKQMIQDVGNVELFELFETDPKTQCTECLSYWSEGIVYCTCGHLFKETVANRRFIEHTSNFLSIPEYVTKKGRSHGHRCGKTPEKKEYHLAHNLKKRCIKRHFTGIHDRFLRDHVFVNVCSNMIEMKMFVLTGTILQNKISPIEWQNQNICDTNKIGGSLSISPETKDHWETVLTSTKRWPHAENLEDNNSGPCRTWSTSNGNRHRVLLPPGGNGVDPGGLPKNSKKVNERGCMQRLKIERGNPFCCR